MAESRWLILTRAVGQATHVRDQTIHRVNAAERYLEQAEAEFVEASDVLARAVAALHVEFPELLDAAGLDHLRAADQANIVRLLEANRSATTELARLRHLMGLDAAGQPLANASGPGLTTPKSPQTIPNPPATGSVPVALTASEIAALDTPDHIEQPSARGPGWGTRSCTIGDCDWESYGGYEAVTKDEFWLHIARVHDGSGAGS